MREHLEHLPVLTEHVGFELRDAVRIGDKTQMFQQQRADTASLEPVENRERDFRASRIGAANITADADKPLATVLSNRRREPDVILEIELGQPLQILRRQIAPDPHESKINRLLAKPPEMLMQPVFIVSPNRPNPHRDAIEHRSLDAIFLCVRSAYLARYSTGRGIGRNAAGR